VLHKTLFYLEPEKGSDFLKVKLSIKGKIVFTATLLVAMLAISSFAMLGTVEAAPTLLDPSMIPKFTNQLTGPPPVYVPKIIKDPLGKGIAFEYTVTMDEKMQQILPTTDALGNPTGFGMTPVWGYGGQAKDSVTGKKIGFVLNSPGPSFEAIRGIPSVVKWINNINTPYMFAVDPTLHWANPNNIPMDTVMDQAMNGLAPPFPPGYNGLPYAGTNPNGFNAQSPAPLVAHLHGGEVSSLFDGNPDSWYTYNGIHGTGYNTLYPTASNAAVFYYPNDQPPATLWYHDHGLGVTRLNVMSGLAGFYLLRDPKDLLGYILPSDEYEMPLAIQDRIFQSNGAMYFPAGELPDEVPNPDMHPYWAPEFFGNTIMVNGLVWPNMDVAKTLYRLRLLDGSNARFYTLSFVANPDTPAETVVPFTQIGTEGGYMKSAVKQTQITIAPGERADVLVDFSKLAAGTKILLKNTANAPFPDGDPASNADPATTGQIMQFTVTNKKVSIADTLKAAVAKIKITPGSTLNKDLRGIWPTLPSPTNTRILTLWEVMGMGGPLEVLVNGQKWAAPVSEEPKEGTTEDWVIVNLTGDTHPIHTHLTQFQLVGRYTLTDPDAYATAWTALNGGDPPYMFTPQELNPFTAGYIAPGSFVGPKPNEHAWKDTIQMNPGEATVIRIRFAPIDGTAKYPFDPTIGPGYVWHCHIIDHEDNEMMRPYIVVK
jgi:FtsP/CotA-like multicopper oxidase with cupredoxin domain